MVVIRDFLLKLREKQPTVTTRIIYDARSHSTGENIANAAEMISNWGFVNCDSHSIIIFCDSSRTLRVGLLTKRFLPSFKVQIETYDILRGKGVRWQVFATLYEYFTLWFPSLDWPKMAAKRIKARFA